MSYIVVDSVSKNYSYGGYIVNALKNVSLSIDKGSITCILGPNGSGKTTLLKIIAGFLKPDSGSVYVDGNEITRFSWDELVMFRRRYIGFIFQEDILIYSLSVYENLDLGLKPYIKDRSKRDEAIYRALRRLGIEKLVNRLYGRLSEGEKKKVSIALAYATEPEIMLADEPTSHLDEEGVNEVSNIIKDLNREGVTVIVATHDSLLANMINKKIFLRGGVIVDRV